MMEDRFCNPGPIQFSGKSPYSKRACSFARKRLNGNNSREELSFSCTARRKATSDLLNMFQRGTISMRECG